MGEAEGSSCYRCWAATSVDLDNVNLAPEKDRFGEDLHDVNLVPEKDRLDVLPFGRCWWACPSA